MLVRKIGASIVVLKYRCIKLRIEFWRKTNKNKTQDIHNKISIISIHFENYRIVFTDHTAIMDQYLQLIIF